MAAEIPRPLLFRARRKTEVLTPEGLMVSDGFALQSGDLRHILGRRGPNRMSAGIGAAREVGRR